MRASCNLPQRKSPRNPLIRFDSSLKRLPTISLLSGASESSSLPHRSKWRWTSLLWTRAKIILAKGPGGSLNRQLFTQRQARANKRLCARPLHLPQPLALKAQITRERLYRPELSSGMRRFDSSVPCRIWLETLSHLTCASFEVNLRIKAHALCCGMSAASNWKGRRRHAGAAGVPRAPQFPEHDASHGAGAGPR